MDDTVDMLEGRRFAPTLSNEELHQAVKKYEEMKRHRVNIEFHVLEEGNMQVFLTEIHQYVQREEYHAEVVIAEGDVSLTLTISLPKESARRILDAKKVVRQHPGLLDPCTEVLGRISYPIGTPFYPTDCCEEEEPKDG